MESGHCSHWSYSSALSSFSCLYRSTCQHFSPVWCVYIQTHGILIIARCSGPPGFTYSCSGPHCRPETWHRSPLVGRRQAWRLWAAFRSPQTTSEGRVSSGLSGPEKGFFLNHRGWVKVMVLWLADSLCLTSHGNSAWWCTWAVVWAQVLGCGPKEGWKLGHRIYLPPSDSG